jgi:hypothetical protein
VINLEVFDRSSDLDAAKVSAQHSKRKAATVTSPTSLLFADENWNVQPHACETFATVRQPG